jgi:signal transduction histidine kinase
MLAANTLISMVVPQEEIFVRTNSAQLVQLLINICKNAGDSYNDRPGIVEVLVRMPDAGEIARIADGAYYGHGRLIGVPMSSQAYGCIRIRDAGSGIAPDVLHRMFDPFFSTKGKRGTGLGLSIVQRIIDSQSGFCLIETAVGKGTTFSIYLLRADTELRQGAGRHIPTYSESPGE